MKKVLSVVLAVAMIAALALAFTGCSNSKAKYKIGICQIEPHVALDAATQGFKDALIKELGKDNVEFIEQTAQGETTACLTIINDFVSKKVDLILANATPVLQTAANATTTIPVLGTSVTEYGTALHIENFSGTVGGNISGTSDLAPLDQQAEMILDIFPETKTVAMLYCSAEANSDYQVKEVTKYLTAKGIKVQNFSFADSNDVISVARAAAAASDVIYIPTDNTAATCTEAINGAIVGTPAVVGEEGICKGCGAITLSISYYDIGVKTGEMAAKILKGEAKISEMPIQYADTFTKKYNKANCEALKIDTAALEAKGYVAIAD